MADYGIPKAGLELVQIEGVGPKRAQRLCNEGIFRVADIADLPAAHLAHLIGSGPGIAEKILASAKALHPKVDSPTPTYIEPIDCLRLSTQNPPVDPYRLRRALELRVDHLSAEVVRVSGGTEPHTVSVTESAFRKRSYSCDCADFSKGHPQCKHVLRARLALHDDADLKPMLTEFSAFGGSRPLRISLAELWMKIGKSYDAYNGRKVDYAGTTFLQVPDSGVLRAHHR
jgi:hypothetical protein